MKVDFHCHSNHSDGVLTPLELLTKAEKAQLKMLAITDHDNIDSWQAIKNIETPVQLITGVEFSTTWNRIGIHIIGLNFDPDSSAMLEAIAFQSQARQKRAQLISKKVERFGLQNAYEKILNQNIDTQKVHIGRPDFADLLVKEQIVKDHNQAYKKILGAGKVGDVKNQWLSFQEVIQTLKLANGFAVIAHPLYYKLTNTKLSVLIEDFKSAGGDGMEVISGFQNRDRLNYLLKLCNKYQMPVSVGSDFHYQTRWNHLGCETGFLIDCKKIWNYFEA